MAGFTQATVLAGAALVLAFQSAQRLISPAPVEQIGFGINVILISLAAVIGLVLLQTWVVRQTGSTAITADCAHYLKDIALNIAVLAALGVTRLTGWERADPAFALAISGYMIWNSYKISAEVMEQLLDRELPQADRERIEAVLLVCDGVRRAHDLRTRNAGDRRFIEFHLEVDGETTVEQGREVCDVAEKAVDRLFPSIVETTAHLEPAGIDDARPDKREPLAKVGGL